MLGDTNVSITQRAMDAIKEGDVEKVGQLMFEAQKEFDTHASKGMVLYSLHACVFSVLCVFGVINTQTQNNKKKIEKKNKHVHLS